MKDIQTIILAAGRGTRMKSPLPKVLHDLGGRTLLECSLGLAGALKSQKTVAVIPPKSPEIENEVKRFEKTDFAVQNDPKGTAHAVNCGLAKLKVKSGDVLVLNADMPFVSKTSVKNLIKSFKKSKAVLGVLTSYKEDPTGFGRIVRGESDEVLYNVEQKDASHEEQHIQEVNLGVYVFDLQFLRKNINSLGTKNKQGEYYLPDLIALAKSQGKSVVAEMVGDETESLGINSQAELAYAREVYYEMRRLELMENGVGFYGHSIFVDADVKVGPGSELYSPCYLRGSSKLGKSVVIEPGVFVRDSVIGDGSVIKANSYVDGAVVGKENQIGPSAHLRPGADLASEVKVGNFVEIKKSKLAKGVKASHLSYLGDAKIGEGSNIGAGTITCNYDGKNKHQTVIGAGSFIGSDTQLVAPVKLGKGAYIGAGTTVTKNVPAGHLYREQKNWIKKKIK
jgi:bifunctional UDP-N-acetylglucosamine pyrophosphorylase/glucosamine-1-phosphate N-acetyltransferase